MSTREAAERWGMSLRYVQRLLNENRIPGARKYGVSWMIPSDRERPPKQRDDGSHQRVCSFFPMIHLHNGDIGKAFSLCHSDEERELLEAQLAYFHCEPQEAKRLASALYRTAAQDETRLGSGIVLALTAMHLGDLRLWRATISELESMALPEELQTEREMALVLVGISMHGKSICPDWMDKGIYDALAPELFPIARFLYVKNLYIKWKEIDLVAVAEPLISESARDGSDLACIYLHVLAAIAYNDLGETVQARAHIDKAADLAMPLELIAPFVEYWHSLGRIAEACLSERYPEKLISLKKRAQPFWDVWATMYNDLWSEPMVKGLTPRELEAVRLSNRGLTASEIAKRMGISVNSVKKYMNVAYGKMNIEKKKDLKTLIHT